MSKARTLADFISDGSEFADGTISVAEVSGAAPLASPTFTGNVTGDRLLLNSGATDEVARFEGTGSPYISWFDSGIRQGYIGSFGNVFSIVGDTPDTTVGIATGGTNRVTVNSTGIDVVGDVGGDTATITGKTTTNELDLSPIAATIADTAVDIFVYDTRKDSDGGAWRKRTQHTSWYNETLNTATRGSRKEFPAVAVIVAESNQVTIYDGDDPDLPMWMVFNAGPYAYIYGGISSVSTVNGQLVTGSNDGLGAASWVDFIGDQSVGSVIYNGTEALKVALPISGRNNTTASLRVVGPSMQIVNRIVNDVAMTVLPNAPIDAATGLPVPTIAVATAGGVSVITDKGTVYDSASTLGYQHVAFDAENTIFYMRNASAYNLGMALDSDYTAGDGFGDLIASASVGGIDFQLLGVRQQVTIAFQDGIVATGGYGTGEKVLGVHEINKSNPADVLSAGITPSYNTGWMNGDIKLATLSDTDATNVTGSELVTNGTFDTDTSGWTALSSATLSVDTNRLKMTNSGTTLGGAYQAISVTVGKTYTVHVGSHEYGTTNGKYFKIGNSAAGAEYLNTGNASSYTHTFTPTQSTVYLTFQTNNNVSGATSFVDNISVRLAEEDRSVNGNGLQVFGTVTKSAVNTGADLVAYSGFSASNYLQQPYNSDLDFGTGDFCIMGWFKNPATTTHARLFQIGQYTNPSFTGGGQVQLRIEATNSYLSLYLSDDNYASYDFMNTGQAVDDGVWHLVVAMRKGNTAYLYIDGVLKNSMSIVYAAGNISNSGGTLRIGTGHDDALPNTDGYQALWRISATAPSPEQIAKIYEDEKVLFQEGAQATLYGSSDAVTALAYDDSTELLHVGTSAGRSVFQGLRRVDNTTTAVGAAISASNGLVADE